MDVQKTMAFILQQQAKTAELLFRSQRRQDIADRGLEGLTKLVRDNTKAIAELRRGQKQTDYKLNALIESHLALIEAQKKTDDKLARSNEKFERLFRAFLRRQNNGRR